MVMFLGNHHEVFCSRCYAKCGPGQVDLMDAGHTYSFG